MALYVNLCLMVWIRRWHVSIHLPILQLNIVACTAQLGSALQCCQSCQSIQPLPVQSSMAPCQQTQDTA